MIGGHGHVTPRADGAKARCGGPTICSECARELAAKTLPQQVRERADSPSPIAFTILGQPASKANSRKIVTLGGRPSVIKSAAARKFEADALKQVPPKFRLRLEGPLAVTLRLYYATERPDLDESIVLDALQDRWKRDSITGERVLVQSGVYRNDRQVREKHVYHGVDKGRPRAEVWIVALQPQIVELDLRPANDPELDAFGTIPPRRQVEHSR